MKGKLRRTTSFLTVCISLLSMATTSSATERQITSAAHGHVLTNTGVWSSDSQWIVYDVRSDAAGSNFDGDRIERVHVESGKVEVLYESRHGAHCGVVTYCGNNDRVVFIHGPEHPTDDWQYAAHHRRGVVVGVANRGAPTNLDARDIVPPFTTGALRGGTHVHTYSGDGEWIAFTYEDHVFAKQGSRLAGQRNVGVSVSTRPVQVPASHSRNHDGSHFSVLVTRTKKSPTEGSDEISRAFSDAWVGKNGYLRPDGTRQEKAIAFQGHVKTDSGGTISEVFVVDIPNDVTNPSSDGPLEGTSSRLPIPPHGTKQRRLSFTTGRVHPGIQGVRHWLRSSPDGSRIAFLMKDDEGTSQLWVISPNGGKPRQVSSNSSDIGSAFTWSPNGRLIAHVMDHSVCMTDTHSGYTTRLTDRNPSSPIRPEACVFSPDGNQIAYAREVRSGSQMWNQVFVVSFDMSNIGAPPDR